MSPSTRSSAARWFLFVALLALQPGQAAVRYFDITGATATTENACPIWVPWNFGDDCSYDASKPFGLGTAQWIGPVFSAGYYAPGNAPAVFSSPEPPGPIAAPAPVLPLGGKTGIPISKGFISIDDRDTPADGSDDVIGGTVEFGAFERNLATGVSTRAVESIDRIIHRIVTPAGGASNVSARTPNASGGFDYVVGNKGGVATFPQPLTGSSDSFPSETGSQSSLSETDVSFWTAAGPAGIARLEGAGAAVGASTQATVWGYSCDAGTGPDSCATSALNWEADTYAGFDNVLIRLSTDSTGNITSGAAYLVNESDLWQPVAGNDTWQATTLAFSGTENALPLAFDQRYLLVNGEVTEVTGPVLLNSRPGALPVTVSKVTEPTHGTAEVVNNAIRYIPNGIDFEGTDTFVYRITDADGETSTASYSMLLTDDIVCADDAATAIQNQPTVIDVLANDSGFDIPPVELSVVGVPSRGTALVNPDRTITFTPPENAGGTFTFRYRISDGTGTLDAQQCTTTVTVDPVPVAVDDSFEFQVATPTALTVTNNDLALSEGPYKLEIVTPPQHGTADVVVSPLSGFPFIGYTSDAGYVGPDTIQYRISDCVSPQDIDADGFCTNIEDTSNVATVSITVFSTPEAVDDGDPFPFPYRIVRDQSITIDVLANDLGLAEPPIRVEIATDIDGNPLVQNGTAVVNPDNTVTFTPSRGFVGRSSTPGEILLDTVTGAFRRNERIDVRDANDRLVYFAFVFEVLPDRLRVRDAGPTTTSEPPLGSTLRGALSGATATVGAGYVAPCQLGCASVSGGAGFRYRIFDGDGVADETANQDNDSEGLVLIDVFPKPVTDSGGSSTDAGLLAALAGLSAFRRRRR
jgi:hypothetical protein